MGEEEAVLAGAARVIGLVRRPVGVRGTVDDLVGSYPYPLSFDNGVRAIQPHAIRNAYK